MVGPGTLRPFAVLQLCTRSLPSSFDLDSFVLLRPRFCLAFPYISDPDLDSGAGWIAVRGGMQLSAADFGVGFCFLGSKIEPFVRSSRVFLCCHCSSIVRLVD